MKGRYVFSIAVAIALIPIAYYVFFGLVLDLPASKDPADWSGVGDYFGGIANPLLSFISIVLIVNSLNLQREANAAIREDLDRARRAEGLRIFEERFFRLVDSLRAQYDSFEVKFVEGDKEETLRTLRAVKKIEDVIEELLVKGAKSSIRSFIDHCDADDHIYSCLRRFSVVIRLVSLDLSDKEGYSAADRHRYLQSLINFSDFGLIRLVLATTAYVESEAARAIDGNSDFLSTCKELGMEFGR